MGAAHWYWGIAGLVAMCCPCCLACCYGDDDPGQLVIYEATEDDKTAIDTKEALSLLGVERIEAIRGMLNSNKVPSAVPPAYDRFISETDDLAKPKRASKIYVGRVVATSRDGAILMHRFGPMGSTRDGTMMTSGVGRKRRVAPAWLTSGMSLGLYASKKRPTKSFMEPCLDLLRPSGCALKCDPFYLDRPDFLPAAISHLYKAKVKDAHAASRMASKGFSHKASHPPPPPREVLDQSRLVHFNEADSDRLHAGPWSILTGPFTWAAVARGNNSTKWKRLTFDHDVEASAPLTKNSDLNEEEASGMVLATYGKSGKRNKDASNLKSVENGFL